jgi:hypothetical protein
MTDRHTTTAAVPEILCEEGEAIHCRPAINPLHFGTPLDEQVSLGVSAWVATPAGSPTAYPDLSHEGAMRQAATALLIEAANTHVTVLHASTARREARWRRLATGSVVLATEAGELVGAAVVAYGFELVCLTASFGGIPAITPGLTDRQVVEGFGLPLASITRAREELYRFASR